MALHAVEWMQKYSAHGTEAELELATRPTRMMPRPMSQGLHH